LPEQSAAAIPQGNYMSSSLFVTPIACSARVQIVDITVEEFRSRPAAAATVFSVEWGG
jgi:hypothetical protein